MVGKAYGCLSDPQKRKHYNMFGNESDQPQGFHDINPDEIFKQFFGNGGIEDIFAQAFGAQMGQMGGNRRGGGQDPMLAQMMGQMM